MEFFIWIAIFLGAWVIKKCNKISYQRDYDNDPYTGAYKSDGWYRKHGLTKEKAMLLATIREINRFKRYTQEETARQLQYKVFFYKTDDLKTYEGALKAVKENWGCLKEIDEKPEYRYKISGRI